MKTPKIPHCSAGRRLVGTLALLASLGSAHAAINVTLNTFRAFPTNFFGSNGQAEGSFNWDQPTQNGFNETYQSVLATMNLGFIRFPTGTGSNYWDWKAGGTIGYMDGGNNNFVSTLAKIQTHLGYAGSSTEPIFLMNLLTDPQNNSLAAINGPTVGGQSGQYQLDGTTGILNTAWTMPTRLYLPYIELGNEFYLTDGGTGTDNTNDYSTIYPDGTANTAGATYATCVNNWMSNIHGQEHTGFPYTCASVGAYYQSPARRTSWNQGPNGIKSGGGNGTGGLFSKLTPATGDAVTIHIYMQPNLGSSGSPMNTSQIQNLLAVAESGYETMSANDFTTAQGTQGIPTNVPVWLTEYNVDRFQSTAYGDTWAHGLALASMSLKWLEESQIQIMVHHDIVGSAIFADIFQDISGLSNVGPWATTGTPPPSVQFGLTAGGLVSRIINTAALGQKKVQEMIFSTNPTVIPPNGVVAHYQTLIGWKFWGAGLGNHGVILNLGASSQTVNVSSFMSSGSYVQISGDPAYYITDGTRLAAVSATSTGTYTPKTLTANPSYGSHAFPNNTDTISNVNSFPLPAYSITYLNW